METRHASVIINAPIPLDDLNYLCTKLKEINGFTFSVNPNHIVVKGTEEVKR